MTDQSSTASVPTPRRGKYDPATVAVAALSAIPFLLGMVLGAAAAFTWTFIIAD